MPITNHSYVSSQPVARSRVGYTTTPPIGREITKDFSGTQEMVGVGLDGIVPRTYTDFGGIATQTDLTARNEVASERLFSRLADDVETLGGVYQGDIARRQAGYRRGIRDLQGNIATSGSGLATGLAIQAREDLREQQRFAAIDAHQRYLAAHEDLSRRAVDDVASLSDVEFELLLASLEAQNRQITSPTGRTTSWF